MATESLCYSVCGLSNILHLAGMLGDTVNQIGALECMLCLQGYFLSVVMH